MYHVMPCQKMMGDVVISRLNLWHHLFNDCQSEACNNFLRTERAKDGCKRQHIDLLFSLLFTGITAPFALLVFLA
jgi:hypothetical protein